MKEPTENNTSMKIKAKPSAELITSKKTIGKALTDQTNLERTRNAIPKTTVETT